VHSFPSSQLVAAPGRQVPVPSHLGAATNPSLPQLADPHRVAVEYFWHPPAPSQTPVVPQLVESSVEQDSVGSDPAEAATQLVPEALITMQDPHELTDAQMRAPLWETMQDPPTHSLPLAHPFPSASLSVVGVGVGVATGFVSGAGVGAGGGGVGEVVPEEIFVSHLGPV
jgi:hypothetical protein